MPIEPVGDLLALDPGLRHPAAALFRGGVLIAAERVKLDPSWKDLDPADRWVRIAGAIVRWGIGRNMEPRWLVYERPQIYTAAKSKGDPNDLVGLAGVASALAGMLSYAVASRDIALGVASATPATWIGQVPKSETGNPWASARGVRIGSRLTEDERQAVVPSHDAVDATGIGLYFLGRLAPTVVYGGVDDPAVS